MTNSIHAPVWLSRAAAQQRAQSIGDLRYRLAITVRARALDIRIAISFELHAQAVNANVLIDWRPRITAREAQSALGTLSINGHKRRGTAWRHGHLHIPRHELRTGRNNVEMRLRAPIGAAESAVTYYADPVDGSEYVYSLFVPADASTLFPCFDQPDLKGRYTLELSVPHAWRAISNAPTEGSRRRGALRTFRFAETEPISTYAFAFAAGPFVALAPANAADATRLWVRKSQQRCAAAHAQAVFALNRTVLDACARYFAHPFPFAKYDLVLIPQLPYRGMEHAGATFLNEECVLLPHDCSATERLQRAQLIFHETAHQWMGDLVTMRWFDDLWIKEGFANFMAYKLAALSFPRQRADVAFHVLKLSAYQTDQTRGASPLHSNLPDLAQAKAAYGSIVYAKAPAVLRQLEFMLGTAVFRRAVRAFVARHAYAAADWRDLLRAFEDASGRTLEAYAKAWILRSGVPLIGIATTAHARAKSTTLTLQQTNARAPKAHWPLRMAIRASGGACTPRAMLDFDAARIAIALPRTQVRCVEVLTNAGDHAYALPRIDDAAIDNALARLARSRAPLDRMQAWSTLWQAVQTRRLAPARFVHITHKHVFAESDDTIVSTVLDWLRIAIDKLLTERAARSMAASIEESLWAAVQTCRDPGMRRTWLAGYIALARTPPGCERLVTLISDLHAARRQERIPRIAALLVVRGALSPSQAIAHVPAALRDPGLRLALAASVPDRTTKRRTFERLLGDRSLPDAVLAAHLAYLNHPAHARLTLPLLRAALCAVPAIAARRKIFFVDRWIAAFVGAQASARALAVVCEYVAAAAIDANLRAKLIEASDGLARTVAIRARFGGRADRQVRAKC